MRVIRPIRWILGIVLGLDLLYAVGVSVFLNTSLFAQVTKMQEDDQTYVRFHGAVSPFPGFLWSPSARVFIGDQNVSIGIDLHDVRVHFEVFPFLKRQLIVNLLTVREAEVDVGMKSLHESYLYFKHYTKRRDLDLKKRLAKAELDSKTHLTLDFKRIVMERIHNIRGGFGRFDGELALDGGFLMQPKVQVEVYPSTVTFKRGITGTVFLRFERFKIVDAPGNVVFPYVTAKLNFRINTNSIQNLNLALESLEGYSLDQVGSNGSVNVSIVKGRLQPGSRIEALPTQLSLRFPGITASGIGKVVWTVDRRDSSLLSTDLRGVRIRDPGLSASRGTLRDAHLHVRFYGNGLVHAFSGLSASFGFSGLRWPLSSGEDRNENFSYEGYLTGQGTLRGLAGRVPDAERLHPKPTQLSLAVEGLRLRTSFLPELLGEGSVRASAAPISLEENLARFPELLADLKLHVAGKDEVRTQLRFRHLEHRLTPENSWKGELAWTLDRTDPVIDTLATKTSLSPIVRSLAKVRDLRADADLEVSTAGTWIRINELRSSGAWSGYGTLRNAKQGMNGLFELSVLGLPVGLKIAPDAAETKFLPSREWYDTITKTGKRGRGF